MRTLEGGGFAVRRPFPSRELPHLDPFLLLDEMGPADYAPGEAKGAPDHPHRGFETVTYLLAGRMEHRDSAGHAGALGPGDVQWMTAGAGVVHSEMPAAEILRDGGRLHGFQLWVNLPKRDKMCPPRYQEVPASRIPVVRSPDGVTVRVVAGESMGERAVIETRTPILYLHATLPPGTSWTQPVPPACDAAVYLFAGSARAGEPGRNLAEGDLALFGPAGATVRVECPLGAPSPAEVLLLAGEPLREPIARYGPFVMNEEAEIVQAIEDYRAGRMGRIRPATSG